jgi:hypothetical protein
VLAYKAKDYRLTEEQVMNIDCYLSHGCGSEEALRKNIAQALSVEKVEAEVNYHKIDDEKAIAIGLSGSPSVFVNGKEIQPQGTAGFS